MSLKGKPITIGHKGVVNSQNIDALHPVGTVLSEGRKDDNNIVADIILYTLPTEDRELSCGYTLDLDETSGVTPDGEHYDAVQRNIRYNHLAIVHRGRAGVSRLNMDGDQVIEDSNKEDEMVKIRIDSGLEYETAPEVKVYAERLAQENQDLKSEMAAKDKRADEDLKTIKAEMAEKQKATDEEISSLKAEIEKLKAGKKEKEAEADEAKKDCEAAKAELEKAKQDSSTLQAKCDSAEADVQKLKEEAEKKDEEFKANFDSAVKERIEMLSIAKAHNIEKADEMNAHDIKVAVIKSVRGDSFDLEGKDDNYINVCYDLCKDDETKEHDDGMSAQRQQFGKQNDRKDSDDSDELSVEELEKRLRKDESELYLKEVK